MSPWLIGLLILLGLTGALVMAAVPLRDRMLKRELAEAFEDFRLQREQLEARFLDMARSLGKPRGLRWLDIDWLPDVTFARELQTNLLTAFVAVNIHFEAIEGGDMEDVEAVGTVRDGSAVFHYRRGSWGTGGRALFNMNPRDAVVRLAGQYAEISPDVSTPISG